MRGERGMSDVVETTSDEDGGGARARGADGGAQGGSARREGGGARGVKGRDGCKGAIILLFHRGRTPRWR